MGKGKARRISLSLGVLLIVLASLQLPLALSAYARRVYVGNNNGGGYIWAISTANNLLESTVAVGAGAHPGIAITPDGSRAYTTDYHAGTVSAINTTTNAVVATISPVAGPSSGIAIAPDGSKAYVPDANDAGAGGTGNVTVINTAANTVSSTISIATPPQALPAIAINPAGTRAYVVVNVGYESPGYVKTINTATDTVLSGQINVGVGPRAAAISPDGSRLYVSNGYPNTVSVINTSTGEVTATISGFSGPYGLAVSPDGSRLYVINSVGNSYTEINTSDNSTVRTVSTAGTSPSSIVITPDGSRAYLNSGSAGTPKQVEAFTAGTGISVATTALDGGEQPYVVAVVPNQGPTASFTVNTAAAGSATSFNASGSSDSDGSIATYAWSFGDGATTSTSSSTTSHTYASAGTYTATLTVTDNEGASTSKVFTGQTVSQNGSSAAQSSATVTIIAQPSSAPPPPSPPPQSPSPASPGSGSGQNPGGGRQAPAKPASPLTPASLRFTDSILDASNTPYVSRSMMFKYLRRGFSGTAAASSRVEAYLVRVVKAKATHKGKTAAVTSKERCYKVHRPARRIACNVMTTNGVAFSPTSSATSLHFNPLGTGSRAKRALKALDASKRLRKGKYRLTFKAYATLGGDAETYTFNFRVA